jgi:hypothetical protein
LTARLETADERSEMRIPNHLSSPRGQEQKELGDGDFFFFVYRAQRRSSVLISDGAVRNPVPRTEFRLNTYSDSVGTAGVLTFKPSNPDQPSSATIKRRGAVQKLLAVHPPAIHSIRRAATASSAIADGWAAPVFCGPAAGADAPKLVRRHSELCCRSAASVLS